MSASGPRARLRRVRWARCARHGTAIALLCTGPGHAVAQIYSSAPGVGTAVVLSSFQSAEAPNLLLAPPDATPAVAAAVGPPRSMPAGRATPGPPAAKASAEMRRLVDTVASQVQLSPDLLHAVIAVESNYDPAALSPRGAMGLMQLLPATARRFGARDPFAAADNLLAGAAYLKWLMTLFDGDLELVLAAYNSGEQAVIKAGRRIPPIAETQAYVPRVLARLPQGTSTLR